MAFSYTVTERGVLGVKKYAYGTYTNGSSDTGGDITTGLSRVDVFFIQPTGSAVIANNPVVNKTFPVSDGVVTIVTTANEDGIWFALGK